MESWDSQAKSERDHVDDGGGLADIATIEARILADFESLAGTIYTDEGDIPGSASARFSGVFTDPVDAKNYLESGGLITYDADGNTVPFPWVYLLREYDEDINEYVYYVYIDDET